MNGFISFRAPNDILEIDHSSGIIKELTFISKGIFDLVFDAEYSEHFQIGVSSDDPRPITLQIQNRTSSGCRLKIQALVPVNVTAQDGNTYGLQDRIDYNPQELCTVTVELETQ